MQTSQIIYLLSQQGAAKDVNGSLYLTVFHSCHWELKIQLQKVGKFGRTKRKFNNGQSTTVDMSCIPYNPYLLLRYDCHINVEYCASVKVYTSHATSASTNATPTSTIYTWPISNIYPHSRQWSKQVLTAWIHSLRRKA